MSDHTLTSPIAASAQRMQETCDRLIAISTANAFWKGDQCPNSATSTSRP